MAKIPHVVITKISVVILVGGNYDKKLFNKCLESVLWADEIVKIDMDASKNGFAYYRNEGAKRARGEWLLYVDTDEEITANLRKEIELIINNSELKINGYAIPRRNFIFGKEMKHGGLWPDFVLRLIKKDKLKGWTGDLHEQPKVEGETRHLKEPLIHNKHKTLTEMVEKTNDWSEIEARLMLEAKHPPMNIFRFASAALREFWKRMIVQASFLDGTYGIIYGLYQVFSRLISYSKLWEMQRKRSFDFVVNNARSNT